MSEEIKETKVETQKTKKRFFNADVIETITVVLLGITALLTAWASYAGSIHGGNQATNYAKSNNIAADGNSRYNEANQKLVQDMDVWSRVTELELEVLTAEVTEDEMAEFEAVYKLKWLCEDSLAPYIAEIVGWDNNFTDDQVVDWVMNDERATASPFADEEFLNSYYEDAMSVLAESEEVLKQGQQDNANGDSFTLVTVIYSVVLFLLGIVGVFKKETNKTIVLIISFVGLVAAFVFMCTIPLPTSGGIFG